MSIDVFLPLRVVWAAVWCIHSVKVIAIDKVYTVGGLARSIVVDNGHR